MLRFLFGIIVGAVGYWAFEQGLLPFGSHDPFDQVTPGAGAEIIRPTASEIATRPAAPIPS